MAGYIHRISFAASTIRYMMHRVYVKFSWIRSYIIGAERRAFIRTFAHKILRISGRPDVNVLMIIIDCLRYRNVSFAGYKRRTTPFLDSFRVKLKAYAAAPHTYSSVPSILTGLYPHNHGAIIGGTVKHMDSLRNYYPLKSYAITLPELLKVLYNYDVMYISAIFPALLPFITTMILLKDTRKVIAEKVLGKAWEIISKHAKSNRKFFIIVHLGDLHEPLTPPEEYRNYFGKVDNISEGGRWAYRRTEEQRGVNFENYKYNRLLLYDNTLRYVDASLQDFLQKVEDIKSHTLIIITSDHGEEFWEHAKIEAQYFYDPRGFFGVGHGHNLFNEIIEVPLIIESTSSEHVKILNNGSKLISLADLAPTILEFLGLEFNESFFDGYSLLRNLPKERSVISEAVAYGYEKKAFIKGKYKLLYAPHDGVAWVFDLGSDPLELNPIADKELISMMVYDLKRILARDLVRMRMLKHV